MLLSANPTWDEVADYLWSMLRPDVPAMAGTRALLAVAYALARREAEAERQ